MLRPGLVSPGTVGPDCLASATSRRQSGPALFQDDDHRPTPHARLAALGFEEPWVREHVLPDWWGDRAADHPVGFTEAVWIIAKHLRIDPAVLRGQIATDIK